MKRRNDNSVGMMLKRSGNPPDTSGGEKLKAKKAHNFRLRRCLSTVQLLCKVNFSGQLGKVFGLGVLCTLILAMALPQPAFAQGAGKALDFDGNDDRVVCGSFDPPSQGTVEFWINADIVGARRRIMGGDDAFEALVKDPSGGVYTISHQFFHGGPTILDNTNPLSFDKWYHVACTWDISTNTANIYINGVLDGTGSNANDDPNADVLTIGTRTGSAEYFDGRLDEVRIWNVVRTAAQIRENMCKKLTPSSEANLVAYWKLDESVVSGQAADSKGSYDGTYYGDMTDEDCVWSGAAIGDESAYDYIGSVAGDFSANITHTDGDDITATGDGGTFTGIQVYLVDETSMRTDATKPTNWTMDPLRYWGVFAVGTIPTYTVTYNYDGHPGITDDTDLGLAVRDDHNDNSWVDLVATLDTGLNTLTKILQSGTEYALGSKTGDNTLPVELSAFTAQLIDNTLILNWVTQTETNNAGWNIYRGETNEAFSNEEAYLLNLSLGLIPGAGTTSEPTEYSFEDFFPIVEGNIYFYWLESVDYSSESEIYGPISLVIPAEEWQNPNSPEIPKPYGLKQNYPNPFNPNTEISFMMKESCIGELSIFNIKGQKIKTIFTNSSIPRDELIISIWNGKDESGIEVSTGVYLYELKTNKEIYLKRMLLIK